MTHGMPAEHGRMNSFAWKTCYVLEFAIKQMKKMAMTMLPTSEVMVAFLDPSSPCSVSSQRT